jgi:hypothetical protein
MDMWRPFTNSMEQWARTAASSTTSSTFCSMPTKPPMKCAERGFFRKGGRMRGAVKGKRWCC